MPFQNFCSFFYWAFLFFLLIWRKSLNHLDQSFVSYLLNFEWCHPAMTSVFTSLFWTHIFNCLAESSTWLSHRHLTLNLSLRDQHLPPSRQLSLLGSTADFQAWNQHQPEWLLLWLLPFSAFLLLVQPNIFCQFHLLEFSCICPLPFVPQGVTAFLLAFLQNFRCSPGLPVPSHSNLPIHSHFHIQPHRGPTDLVKWDSVQCHLLTWFSDSS